MESSRRLCIPMTVNCTLGRWWLPHQSQNMATVVPWMVRKRRSLNISRRYWMRGGSSPWSFSLLRSPHEMFRYAVNRALHDCWWPLFDGMHKRTNSKPRFFCSYAVVCIIGDVIEFEFILIVILVTHLAFCHLHCHQWRCWHTVVLFSLVKDFKGCALSRSWRHRRVNPFQR